MIYRHFSRVGSDVIFLALRCQKSVCSLNLFAYDVEDSAI